MDNKELIEKALKIVEGYACEWEEDNNAANPWIAVDKLIILCESHLRESIMAECQWNHTTDLDGEQSWPTSCGEEFVLIEGSPAENLYNFCPNCGGKIVDTETKALTPEKSDD